MLSLLVVQERLPTLPLGGKVLACGIACVTSILANLLIHLCQVVATTLNLVNCWIYHIPPDPADKHLDTTSGTEID